MVSLRYGRPAGPQAALERACLPHVGCMLCLLLVAYIEHCPTAACLQDVIDRMAADGVEPDVFTEETVARRRVLRSYLRKTLIG